LLGIVTRAVYGDNALSLNLWFSSWRAALWRNVSQLD